MKNKKEEEIEWLMIKETACKMTLRMTNEERDKWKKKYDKVSRILQEKNIELAWLRKEIPQNYARRDQRKG